MLEQGTLVINCLEENTCAELFESLVDVLKKEIVLDRELKEFLLAEKQMLLRAPSLDQLQQSNVAKENVILKTRMLEEVRTNLIRKLAFATGIGDEEDVRLSDLASVASPQTRKKLDALIRELTQIAVEIKQSNEASSGILETSIEQMSGSVEFLSTLISRSGIYSGNGRINPAADLGRILRTEG